MAPVVKREGSHVRSSVRSSLGSFFSGFPRRMGRGRGHCLHCSHRCRRFAAHPVVSENDAGHHSRGAAPVRGLGTRPMPASLSIIPKSAPFPEDEIDLLNRVVGSASPTQRAWLSGFLAGATQHVPPQPAAPARPAELLTILFASQSGNC